MVCETANRPETRSTQQMLPLDHPDRIQITFDDRRLVANAGLLLPVTLAQHRLVNWLTITWTGQCAGAGECGRQDARSSMRTGGTAQTLG